MTVRRLVLGALTALGLVLPAFAADSFPSRTITLVVPLAAGTGMDTVVRLYADDLQKGLGKPVGVENQPGAAGMMAASSVARANPDGHTLLVAAIAPLAINQTLYKKIAYDPDRDFVPIALYAKSPFVLVVNPALGVGSVESLLQRARASAAAPLTYSTPGAGFLQHLAMEDMKQRFGFEATHVPYRSSPQAINDVVAGHVQASFAEMGASLALIRDGQLKALAVTSLEPLATLPGVPTLEAATGVPGNEAVSWHVLVAPAATPREVVERLQGEMKRITGAPEFQAKLAAVGLIPVTPLSVDETTAYIRAERAKWGGVVKALGLEGSQ